MGVSVANPKKSLSVDLPIAQIKEAVLHVKDINNKYQLSNSNELLNYYTYAALETLSLGVYIDINLVSKSETSTEISIEVRRKIGTFDKKHEVTLAHEHIEKIINLITSFLQMSDEQKNVIRQKYMPQEGKTSGSSTDKFNCGICKKVFYADRNQSNIAICPHCKNTRTLPAIKKGCFGVILFILSTIATSSILSLII